MSNESEEDRTRFLTARTLSQSSVAMTKMKILVGIKSMKLPIWVESLESAKKAEIVIEKAIRACPKKTKAHKRLILFPKMSLFC